MDFKVIIGFLFILIVLNQSCGTCTESKFVVKKFVLTDTMRNSFDSLHSGVIKMKSNLGRNDELNSARTFVEEGSRWTEEVDSKCRAEEGQTLSAAYGSQLYAISCYIKLEVDRNDKIKLLINPDTWEYNNKGFKRLAIIDPTDLKDSGFCRFHYCLKSGAGMVNECYLEKRDGSEILGGDTTVNGIYKFYPEIIIDSRIYKNCIEVTFDNGKITGSNAIRKVWITLRHGLIKVLTMSNEEWIIDVD